MDMVQVSSSSNIAAVGYDTDERKLAVEFKGGGTYQYDEVPITTYTDLLTAESMGKFFHANIKGKFECRKEVASNE
jgi:hypothetical protein